MKKAYFDYISSAPILEEVKEAMLPYFSGVFGNPQSQHPWGKEVQQAVEGAREKIARLIGAVPEEIFFMASATEANNVVLKGVVQALKRKGRHILTTPIEHLSVLHPLKSLERGGIEVSFLPVDSQGRVDPKDIKSMIRSDTILVSVMHANNEIGTIEPLEEISKITQEMGVYFHTDATATLGMISIDVGELGVDLLSGSAQTLYGPKGVGLLYLKRGTRIRPLIEGGIQEYGKRAGTENVPAIVGFGKAAEIAHRDLPVLRGHLICMRDLIKKGLEGKIESLYPTGSWEDRLPYHGSWCVDYIEGATLLSGLGEKGIAASSGSACSSHALKPSNVLKSIGISEALSKNSLVMSVGLWTTEEEVDYLLAELPLLIQKLRKMSSHFEGVKTPGNDNQLKNS